MLRFDRMSLAFVGCRVAEVIWKSASSRASAAFFGKVSSYSVIVISQPLTYIAKHTLYNSLYSVCSVIPYMELL